MTSEDSRTVTVRWRRQTDPDRAWHALVPAAGDNLGFHEAQKYEFQKPGPGWSFLIDDEPLADMPTRTACCVWEPRFFAGEVTAELLRPDGVRAELYLLDVAPDPSKLGREVFATMITELWAEDPSLVVGTEPAAAPMGELGTHEDPWLAFSRFRRYAPSFLKALAPIHALPRRTLRGRRDAAQLHHVRRVDRRTAMAVVRTPAVALFLDRSDDEASAIDSRLDVPVIEETVDSAVNRALLALLRALIRRSRLLIVTLQDLVVRESQSETRTSLAGRWPARRNVLEELGAQLSLALRRSPFTDVSRAEVTAAGLTGIAADPLYSRAWGQGWRALRYGLESGETGERLWVSPSWEIYERWCFLRLGRLLSSEVPRWRWQRLANPHRWVGTFDERTAQLRLQPTFRAYSGDTDGRWSVSKQREPDLLLTVQGPDQVRYVVLDAKYRTSRENVLDAMTSAHIYQDSLRIDGRRPEASFLLVPAPGGAPWLEDRAFQKEHAVGVIPFSHDQTGRLPGVVKRLVG